jgi:hypothetical protein
MATVRWETPADWAEQTFREAKAAHSVLEQEDAMVALMQEYSATAGFLDYLVLGLDPDTDPAMREPPPSATWYHHLLPWSDDYHRDGSGPFHAPTDQHRALMLLHHLTNDLNGVALDLETRLAAQTAKRRAAAAAAPSPGNVDPTPPPAAAMPADTAQHEDAKLHGAALAAAVEEMRAAVSFWAQERRELQERVDEAEAELTRLEFAGDDPSVVGAAAVDDTSRPALFRQLRNERVQIQAHTDSLRRMLALPL